MPKKKKAKPFDELTIAEKLSDVLHDKDLPRPMLDAIQEGLITLFNSNECDTSEVVEHEKSSWYINALFRGYQPKEQRHA